MVGDVTSRANSQRFVDETVKRFGRADVLVNSAGVAPRNAPADWDWEKVWDFVMAVNMKGTYLMSRAVADQMVKQGGGSIVNLSSIYGLVGRPREIGTGLDPYVHSKGGVVQLTRDMAVHFARENVRVNALCPGFVYTNLTKARTREPRAGSSWKTGTRWAGSASPTRSQRRRSSWRRTTPPLRAPACRWTGATPPSNVSRDWTGPTLCPWGCARLGPHAACFRTKSPMRSIASWPSSSMDANTWKTWIMSSQTLERHRHAGLARALGDARRSSSSVSRRADLDEKRRQPREIGVERRRERRARDRARRGRASPSGRGAPSAPSDRGARARRHRVADAFEVDPRREADARRRQRQPRVAERDERRDGEPAARGVARDGELAPARCPGRGASDTPRRASSTAAGCGCSGASR